MKHSWNKQPDRKVDGIGLFKVWICKVCGAVKELHNSKFSEPSYTRNMQIYTHYVECIDEQAEMLKTID